MAQIGPDELVYVDRRNNVQKLAQGEFVAIAQLETTLYQRPSADLPGLPLRHERAGLPARCRSCPTVKQLDRAGRRSCRRSADQGRSCAKRSRKLRRPKSSSRTKFRAISSSSASPSAQKTGCSTGIGKPKRPSLKERYGAAARSLVRRHRSEAVGRTQQLRARRPRRPGSADAWRAPCRRRSASKQSIPTSAAQLRGPRRRLALGAVVSMLLEEIYDIEVPVGVITHPSGSLQKLARITSSRPAAPTRHGPTFNSVHGTRRDRSACEPT